MGQEPDRLSPAASEPPGEAVIILREEEDGSLIYVPTLQPAGAGGATVQVSHTAQVVIEYGTTGKVQFRDLGCATVQVRRWPTLQVNAATSGRRWRH